MIILRCNAVVVAAVVVVVGGGVVVDVAVVEMERGIMPTQSIARHRQD